MAAGDVREEGGVALVVASEVIRTHKKKKNRSVSKHTLQASEIRVAKESTFLTTREVEVEDAVEDKGEDVATETVLMNNIRTRTVTIAIRLLHSVV